MPWWALPTKGSCKTSVTTPSPRKPTPPAWPVPLAAVTPSYGGSLSCPPSQPSCSYPTLLPPLGWALPIMISPGSAPSLGRWGNPIPSLPPASSCLEPLKRVQFPRVQRVPGDHLGQTSHFDEEKWRFRGFKWLVQGHAAGQWLGWPGLGTHEWKQSEMCIRESVLSPSQPTCPLPTTQVGSWGWLVWCF